MNPKTKIVIASLLKPVDDPRMYEKFARSLAANPSYEIHIIGYPSTEPVPQLHNIRFYPLFRFKRLSWERLLPSLKYYNLLVKLKPDVIIPNTHDLLIVTIAYKILFGSEILYDVQENYFLNILHTDAFPRLLRPFLAVFVRFKEILFSPFIRHFFLAEKVYSKQLPFIGKRFTVLENKYEPIKTLPDNLNFKLDRNKTLKLLYTGTISEHYGIKDAIQTANIISTYCPVNFTIIGRCTNKAFLQEFMASIAPYSYISFIGGENPVDHRQIVNAIISSDIAIVSYKNNKSTAGRIPTKVFEYMANKLPFLVLNYPEWLPFPLKYNACIPVTKDISPDELANAIFESSFYTSNVPLNEILWQFESQKLISVIHSLSH